jgi:hypothetical protein
MKKLRFLAAGAVALAALGTAGLAQARSDVYWSVGVNAAPGVSVGVGNYAAPVYVAPAPVYVAPAPVYVAPPVTYVRPAPVYYSAPAPVYYYGASGYYRHGKRHHRHWN